MTDAHCHATGDATRHFLCGRPPSGAAPAPAPESAPAGVVRFVGFHPWDAAALDLAALRAALAADRSLGVGEIGLDRLRERQISPAMREAFLAQLALAAEFRRPAVLHGAKCWGEVVNACKPFAGRIPAFLFHGFSRSTGLLPEIEALNGFISFGPALLNDHAVNYRRLAATAPQNLLLVETDREAAADAAQTPPPPVAAIAVRLAELRGVQPDALAAALEANADRFVHSLFANA